MQALASLDLLTTSPPSACRPPSLLLQPPRRPHLAQPSRLAAGYPVPQISLHRGHLQLALLDASSARPGATTSWCLAAAVHDFRTEEAGRPASMV
jgi:hypothetical protein